MTGTNRLTLAAYVPSFLVVFVVVRGVWLRYLRTLSESELHTRVFDHSTAVALSIWALCFVLAAVVARVIAVVLTRRTA
ncbi:MAG TPA: hypothetical protein VJ867_17245 [Gemmatimonadaceae bacterium]|nr:hypothetical protein [Gemmatimonadaceae bacterium]